MKPFLYLAVVALLFARTRQLSNEYNMMPFSLIEDIPFDDNGDGLNFTNSFLSISVKDLAIRNTKLTSPFIIQTSFKLHEASSSYIFSLEDKRRNPQLGLEFSPGEENVMRIALLKQNNDVPIVFPLTDLTHKWIDILFFVQDDKVSMYLDCEYLDNRDTKKTTVLFDEDSHFILGKAEAYEVERTFPGSIKNIKIYTQADKSTIKTICNETGLKPVTTVNTTPSKSHENNLMGSLLRDLTEFNEDMDVDYEGLIPPESLTMAEPGRGDGGTFDDVADKTPPEPEKGVKGDKGDTGKPGEQGDRGIKGYKGEKGAKGDAGNKGEPGESIKGRPGPEGPVGPVGPVGPSGKQGEEGKCECSETMVSTLMRMMPEMKGPAGAPGPRGEDGPPGIPGLTGKSGAQGERGSGGLKGEMGEKGDEGRPGKSGKQGPKGDPGNDGHPGSPGPQGLEGPPGPPGPIYVETEEEKKKRQVFIPGVRGDTGPEGPSGPMGPRGYKGDTGEKGERGYNGEKGDRGHQGLEGPRGEKGERGVAGEDGLPGSSGNHGKPGERGEKGDRGDKGTPGLAGLPAKLTDLLDADMDPFENSQIVEKLRGHKGDSGTNGEKGSKGDPGLTGVPGTPGNDGHDGETGLRGIEGPKGETGPMGPSGRKGSQGEPGPPGQVPASEIALMKGSKGDRGVPGGKGLRGPNGYKGPRGATGPAGSKGNKGDIGLPGPMGPIGPAGFNGTLGLKGDKGECVLPNKSEKVKGEKGDRGDAGIPGKSGKPGPPGPAGPSAAEQGSAGLPGPPGPPGPPGISITGPKGEPGSFYSASTTSPFSDGFIHNDDDSYTTNTVVFRSRKALLKRTSTTPLGTLAYVLQEDILLVRIRSGWGSIEISSFFALMRETTPHPKPSPIISTTSTSRPVMVSQKMIRIAALNDPYTGKMHSSLRSGHSAADYECNQQSLGYGGNFRAFLTNRVQNAISIVERRDRNIPVKNLYGELLFPSWNSIFNGSGASFEQNVNIYSFNGRNVMIDQHWPSKAVWHGSDVLGVRLPETFCEEWDDESNSSVGMASSIRNKKLLGQDVLTCDNKLIVLCVEVSSAEQRRKRHYSKRNYSHRSTYRNELGRA